MLEVLAPSLDFLCVSRSPLLSSSYWFGSGGKVSRSRVSSRNTRILRINMIHGGSVAIIRLSSCEVADNMPSRDQSNAHRYVSLVHWNLIGHRWWSMICLASFGTIVKQGVSYGLLFSAVSGSGVTKPRIEGREFFVCCILVLLFVLSEVMRHAYVLVKDSMGSSRGCACGGESVINLQTSVPGFIWAYDHIVEGAAIAIFRSVKYYFFSLCDPSCTPLIFNVARENTTTSPPSDQYRRPCYVGFSRLSPQHNIVIMDYCHAPGMKIFQGLPCPLCGSGFRLHRVLFTTALFWVHRVHHFHSGVVRLRTVKKTVR